MTSISLNKFIEENTPEGMELDVENSTLDNIVFKQKANSTRWEDLGRISGFLSDSNSSIYPVSVETQHSLNREVYATKAQCEAHIAQAQLSQIMQKVNDGWVADWKNNGQKKWCIELLANEYSIDVYRYTHGFLAFKSKELAEQVLRENGDLLEQYKPLAG